MINSNPGKVGRTRAIWVRELIETAENNPQLVSEYNQSFLLSIREKMDYYGEDTWLSEKQIHRLIEIGHSLGLT